MNRDWKPGDVALVEAGCWANQRVALRLDEGWSHTNGVNVDGDGVVIPIRPLVVIDPEDREQVERLVHAFSSQRDWYADTVRQRSDAMQAALREFANPTPAQVYRHFVASKDGGLQRAHCGKVWRRNAEANVTVMGDCPECTAVVEAGWSA